MDLAALLADMLIFLVFRLQPTIRRPIVTICSFSLCFDRVVSASKRKNSGKIVLSEAEIQEGCRLGIDSHADMSCVSAHAAILEVYEGQLCNVMPFNDTYSAIKGVRTVNAAYAHDSDDGTTYLLEVNQALDFSDSMYHALLCPNQARMNGVIIEDCPRMLDHTGKSSHSVYFPKEDIRLPLQMKFPISYLPVRRPTSEELDTCQILTLTSTDQWAPELFETMNCNALQATEPHSLDSDLSSVLSKNIHVSSLSTSPRKSVTAEQLASLWNISLQDAKATIQGTTQDYIRQIEGKLSRRVKTRAHQRQYRQLGGYLGNFCSDTFHSKIPSLRGNQYVQLFCNRGNFVFSCPMKLKSHAHNALDRFLHEVGIPVEMLTDGALELTKSEWGKMCLKHRIRQITTEPYSPWQNPAELSGGIIKRKMRHLMKSKLTPIVLWDYCWAYVCEIRSLTATNNIYLNGETPFASVMGYTPDISEFLTFGWYDWVWYHDPADLDQPKLGRWLGAAHDVGQGLSFYVLTSKGTVKMRSSVSPLSAEDLASTEVSRLMSEFTEAVESIIGNYSNPIVQAHVDPDAAADPYDLLLDEDDLDDMDVEPQELDESGNVVQLNDLDDEFDSAYMEKNDPIIGTRIQLPHESGEAKEAVVIARKRNHDGTLIGTANDNPVLDSRIYEVQFPDGSYSEYSTNVLLENLYQQIDDEGRSHSILSSIVNHSRDDSVAVKLEDGYITVNGRKHRRITTKGWKLEVQWKDGTSSWIPLKILKESNPIEVAEYAVSRGIDKEPAFSYWVNHTLRRRDRIIKQVRHRPVKKNIKFGVRVPNSIEEAYQLDKENGNNLWGDAVNKELKNVIVAFKLLNDGDVPPVGSKEIPYHIIFDVKFDLTRKARLVAGGHRHKEVPSYATYSSVVSRDSVRIIFTIAALNELKIKMADIGNAYLNAPNKERVHVRCGPELFGPESEGKIAVIVRALYGLKSAGNSWRHFFSNYILTELGFDSTVADPDVYRKPLCKPDGSAYYAYIVVYVDDLLVCADDPDPLMEHVKSHFRLKDGYYDPKLYLGTDIRPWSYDSENGSLHNCWAMGAESYIKEAVRTCERLMESHGLSYTSTRRHGRKSPFNSHDYRPELDSSNFCDYDLTTVYQNVIGILRWICELGRIDILFETSILSQYLAQPRVGHLQQALNIFYYLKHNDRSWLVLDPTKLDVEWQPRSQGEVHPQERAIAMKELYPDAKEQLPHNMPQPRGRSVQINVFVDADHAGNKVTRRSHTGIIIMINMAPVIWYSKRQNTVETSTFGSEFIALRIATEMVDSLRYKLRMFGVPIEGPARVFCDNESVVKSSSIPESRLKKKHCSIAYHRVRESVAAGALLIYYERSESNLADLLTKSLTANRREPLVHALLA